MNRERKYISLYRLSMLFLIVTLAGTAMIGCGKPPPVRTENREPYDWRAEIAKNEAEARAARGEPAEEEGVYSTLILTNATSSSTVLRCTVIAGSTKDLLLGRKLRPGQYIVMRFSSDLPKNIKLYWTDSSSTTHRVPSSGSLILTDSNTGYQGTNIQIVEG
ncbi:hypothetical protein LCGC14_1284380 [marine sediment metagenome]|uniref:Uncharacterized protein n=1 Tax=marine sediment metagenome TaxID=412755 RepID=A0A0F9NXC8_9ZZZZ